MEHTINEFEYPKKGILFTPKGIDGGEDLYLLKFYTPEDPALGEAITKNIQTLDCGLEIPQVLLGDSSLSDDVRGAHCPSTGTLFQGSPHIGIHPDDNHYDPETHTLELNLESAAIILHETNHAIHRFAHDGNFEHTTLKYMLGTAEQDLMRGRLSGNPVMRKAAEMETFFLSIADAKKYNMKPETLEMIFQVNLENLTNYDCSIIIKDTPSSKWLTEDEFKKMRADEDVRTTLKRIADEEKVREDEEMTSEFINTSSADMTDNSFLSQDESGDVSDDDFAAFFDD